MDLINLPKNIQILLEQLNAPKRLFKHLQIVHSTAFEILAGLSKSFPSLEIDKELTLQGAALHDIGKTKVTQEIYGGGNEHETVGVEILLKLGYSKDQARFAYSHGNWNGEDIQIEDLIVSLSDNVWCGRRIDELEELASKKISEMLEIDFWDVHPKLNSILDEISIKADERIYYQGE